MVLKFPPIVVSTYQTTPVDAARFCAHFPFSSGKGMPPIHQPMSTSSSDLLRDLKNVINSERAVSL